MTRQLFLLLAILCIASGFAQNKPDFSDTAPKEDPTESAVHWSKLQNRNGDAYLPNTDIAYSGWAKEIYENGQIQTLCEFKKGYIVTFKQWQMNGIPISEANFVIGRVNLDSDLDEFEYLYDCFDKNLTIWHLNGQKYRESGYVKGRINGVHRIWHENGQNKAQVTFKNDKEEGLANTWYENGQKKEEVHFKNGI